MNEIALVSGGEEIAPANWTINDLLEDTVRCAPGAVAVRQFDAVGQLLGALTYAELLEASSRLAGALAARFSRGETVGLWGATGIGWLVNQLALARIGATLVTLDPALGEHEIRFMLEKSRAVGVIMDRSHRGRDLATILDAVRPSLPLLRETLFVEGWRALADEADGPMGRSPAMPEDTALIVFTSGTTGKPKGVAMHHYGLVNNARAAAYRTALAPGSVMLNPLPAYSIGGAATLNLGAMSRHHCQIMIEHFDAGLVLRLIEAQRIAWMPLVPAMLIPMIEHRDFGTADLSSLEAVWMGGTIISPEHVRLAQQKLGVEAQMIYGQTESGGVLTLSRRGCDPSVVARSVGVPLSHSTIRIADLQSGATLAPGVIGEIRLSSPFMTRGYFENPEATAALFDDEGFMKTGDLGLIDESGDVRITGRLKEMIIRGGRNIYPREIEDVIGDYPDVAEVAVVGIPHERWGEEVAAVVKGAAGRHVDLEDVRAFVASRIASYKVPKFWRQVEDFPRGAQGKIRKVDLVTMFRARVDDGIGER